MIWFIVFHSRGNVLQDAVGVISPEASSQPPGRGREQRVRTSLNPLGE